MAQVLNVLVVEDDRVAARAHAAYANRIPGFRTVATVGSAAACLRRLARGDVDLVLIDMHLPDSDGLELHARIKDSGFAAGVVIVSDARTPAALERAVAAGEVCQLVKPFSFAAFEALLARFARIEGAPVAAGRSLPRGMRPDTVEAIAGLLHQCTGQPAAAEHGDAEPSGLSAASVARAVGASRITVRGYLEYLADSGVLARSLRHRTLGRPEPVYRLAAQQG